eukprot:TRINITY_DN70082_c0_g1_i1.p1 TRINITY_DN70082_c0_g1~~TRINITY_DN70082_c0_g1_i1.p1  ORF type:complete len:302 (+),score=87.29 TRINITY_DN70082_c0_g1_i1:71-907(+)
MGGILNEKEAILAAADKGAAPGGPTEEDVQWLQATGWPLVPRRIEILHSSWIFAWASAALLAEFILIKQDFLASGQRRADLVNAVGLVSCVFWLHGFFMLVHWLTSIGASKVALAGGWCKTIASVFFNVQPLGGLLGYYQGAGAPWGNLVGICFFHGGNVISMFDMLVVSANNPGGMNYRQLFTWGNLPVLGMFCYTCGSGLLVAANAWVYESTPGTKGYHPSYAPKDSTIHGFQISGATMLLVGSLVFCHWAGWVPRCGRRPARLDNDFWYAVESAS